MGGPHLAGAARSWPPRLIGPDRSARKAAPLWKAVVPSRVARSLLQTRAMVQPRQLIVIRRGEAELFGILHGRSASGASPADVIWDRRIRDRRVIIRDDVSPERRRTERRATEPSTWTSHGFLITRAAPAPGDEDLRSRPRTRPPLAPGRTQALIDTAIRPGDASACRHLGPRGLRTDADHVRLYARLIRQSSRPLPGQWPASRLRRGYGGFPA